MFLRYVATCHCSPSATTTTGPWLIYIRRLTVSLHTTLPQLRRFVWMFVFCWRLPKSSTIPPPSTRTIHYGPPSTNCWLLLPLMDCVLRLDLYSSSKTKTKDILLSPAPTIPSAIKGWVEKVGGSVCVSRDYDESNQIHNLSIYVFGIYVSLPKSVGSWSLLVGILLWYLLFYHILPHIGCVGYNFAT